MEKELKSDIEDRELENPIQEEIEDRVEEEKDDLEEFLPQETNEAMTKSINSIGRIAKKLFLKKSSLNKSVRLKISSLVKNAVEDFNKNVEDEGFCADDNCDCIPEDPIAAASKLAKIAKNMIIAKENMKVKYAKLSLAEEIVDLANELEKVNEPVETVDLDDAEEKILDARLGCAESLVNIAKEILSNPSFNIKAKKEIKAKIIRLAKDLASAEENYEVSKSDLSNSFTKSNKFLNRRLEHCVDWDALKKKNTTVNIEPETQLKKITLEDLRKIMTTLQGVK